MFRSFWEWYREGWQKTAGMRYFGIFILVLIIIYQLFFAD